jgi:hypothetical protein
MRVLVGSIFGTGGEYIYVLVGSIEVAVRQAATSFGEQRNPGLLVA